MVFEIKHTGETRSGKFVFTPRTIGVLLLHQIRYSFANRRIRSIAAREKPNQAPRRLRSGAVSLPLRSRFIVATQRFAKASIRPLHRAQPAHSALTIFFCRQRYAFQLTQYA